MALTLRDLYDDPDRVVVTAHRGFSGQYPENTIPAFRAAVALGVDILEFDIRGTADDVPIVLHDATFARTADRPGTAADYRLAEIRQFEASYWRGTHEQGEKLAQPDIPGTRVPTFEEVLQDVGDAVGLNIQVYDASPAILSEVCDLYREYDLYARGYLSMSTFMEARHVRHLDDRIELCVLERQGHMTVEGLKQHRDFGCRYVQPFRTDVTRAFCEAARGMGLCANMFYANTDEDNRKYLELGIPGVLTDRPDLLIDTVRRMDGKRTGKG